MKRRFTESEEKALITNAVFKSGLEFINIYLTKIELGCKLVLTLHSEDDEAKIVVDTESSTQWKKDIAMWMKKMFEFRDNELYFESKKVEWMTPYYIMLEDDDFTKDLMESCTV